MHLPTVEASQGWGGGERTGSGAHRPSFVMAVTLTNLWDCEQVASALRLTVSICNMRVIMALTSQDCCEDYVGEHLAQCLAFKMLSGNSGCFYGHIGLASQFYLALITLHY